MFAPYVVLVTKALRQLSSPYAPSSYSMGREYKRTLKAARIILDREKKYIVANEQGYLSNNWQNVLPNIRQMPRFN